jgi:ABC-2 type transport system permease protein
MNKLWDMSWDTTRSIFSMELKKALSYRTDFWVQFVAQVFVQVIVAWFLWKAVFQAKGVTQIGGYDFSALLLYYLLVPLIDRLNRGYDNFALSSDIYEGGLTRYLLYPVSFFAYRLTGQFARASFSFLQLLIGIGCFALFYGLPETYTFSGIAVTQGLITCLFAIICYFLLSSAVEMVSFWADNVWSLMVILRFTIQIAGGGLLPLDLFPEWARSILMYTPFPHFLFVPVRLMTGQGSTTEFLQSVGTLSVWILIFAVVSQAVWRTGTREYSGVGI